MPIRAEGIVQQKIAVTPYELAQRFVGTTEVSGSTANPQILAMLRLDEKWPKDDEVPWCSGFVNYVAWLLRLPRSKSLRARSWLEVGVPIPIEAAEAGFDVLILKRGKGSQPGPENTTASGHVGFFGGTDGNKVIVLGGNQNNSVNLAQYPQSRVLGIRRLSLA